MTLHYHINKYTNPKFDKEKYEKFMREFKPLAKVEKSDIKNIRQITKDVVWGILKSNTLQEDYTLAFDFCINEMYSRGAGYPIFEIVDCGEFMADTEAEKITYGTLSCMNNAVEIVFAGTGLSVYIWFDKFEG